MINCDNNNMSVEQILMSILTLDANGNCSVRLIPVVDGNAPYKNCGNNKMDDLALFKSIIGVDGNNNMGIRVIQGSDAGTNCVDCDNKNIPFMDQIRNHIIGLADDGFPALRLATL